MTGYLAFLIWFGLITRGYRLSRELGNGTFRSVLEGCVTPIYVGKWIVDNCTRDEDYF